MEDEIKEYKNIVRDVFNSESSVNNKWAIHKETENIKWWSKKSYNNTDTIRLEINVNDVKVEESFNFMIDSVRHKICDKNCMKYEYEYKIDDQTGILHMIQDFHSFYQPREAAAIVQFWDFDSDGYKILRASIEHNKSMKIKNTVKAIENISGVKVTKVDNGFIMVYILNGDMNLWLMRGLETLCVGRETYSYFKALIKSLRSFSGKKMFETPSYLTSEKIFKTTPMVDFSDIESSIKTDGKNFSKYLQAFLKSKNSDKKDV